MVHSFTGLSGGRSGFITRSAGGLRGVYTPNYRTTSEFGGRLIPAGVESGVLTSAVKGAFKGLGLATAIVSTAVEVFGHIKDSINYRKNMYGIMINSIKPLVRKRIGRDLTGSEIKRVKKAIQLGGQHIKELKNHFDRARKRHLEILSGLIEFIIIPYIFFL